MMNNRTVRILTSWASLALIAAPVLAAPAGQKAARKPGIEGRWNITVTEGDSTYPSWLGVERKDGKLEARFLGRSGGVGGVESFSFEGDTVKFQGRGREYTGKLTGPTIEGTWKGNGNEGKWIAKRSIRRPFVGGTWNLKVDGKPVVLTLAAKEGKFSGKWAEEGKETEIAEIQVRGNALNFNVGDRKIQAVVKGDVMEGKNLSGQRDRKWGKPVELFNGKESDLENWQPLAGGEQWKVIDGVLTNGKGHTDNLVTKRKDFRNFKLHVEFKVPEKGNSGVYLRGRHEVQIADSYGRPIEAGGCGAMYSRVLPAVNACKPAGEWQAYDITFINNYLTVVHNGKTIMDNVEVEGITGGAIDSNENEPGPIYLQGDHSQIFYRKVILTPAR